ncbi:hypothetical protein V6N13_129820 [Hibiscus sabdariffa]
MKPILFGPKPGPGDCYDRLVDSAQSISIFSKDVSISKAHYNFSLFYLHLCLMESLLFSFSLQTPPFPPQSTFFSYKSVPNPTPIFPLLHKAKPRLQPLLCTMSHSSEADTKPKETKLWGGRFEESVTDIVEKFTESISFDRQLYKHDIMGSKAHASMLAQQGLISISERDSILKGLDEIERSIEAGEFVWRTDREDVHMNIEAALTDMVGEPAKKLHTARSRNDQVLTDFRLWCRDAIDRIVSSIRNLQVALVKLALNNEGLIIPGYTHLQRAQPVLLQHLLLAYVEQLDRDAGRLLDCKARLNFSPLGACALAGTGLPIDRFMTSNALGFTAPMRNSIDAVSDRDFVLEFLSANSIIAVHLSRIGEEWVLWASEEFGFITPSDSVSTGSSIMPQKKNPDPMELVRGKSARVIGDLLTLLTLCKGLPLAYNRDLQEDKEPTFDSVKTIIGMLEVSAEFAQNITFNCERIRKALPAGYLDATTLADYLVKKGIPFRTSHDIVGRAVALCVSKNCQLQDLSLEDLRKLSLVFDNDVYEFLGVENAVKKFSSYGSTDRGEVREGLPSFVEMDCAKNFDVIPQPESDGTVVQVVNRRNKKSIGGKSIDKVSGVGQTSFLVKLGRFAALQSKVANMMEDSRQENRGSGSKNGKIKGGQMSCEENELVRPIGDPSKGRIGPVASAGKVLLVSVTLNLSKHVVVRVLDHSKTKPKVKRKVNKTTENTLKIVQGKETVVGKDGNMMQSLSEQNRGKTEGTRKGRIHDSSESSHVVAPRLSQVKSVARLGLYPSRKKQYGGIENTDLNVVNLGEWIGELARTVVDKPFVRD